MPLLTVTNLLTSPLSLQDPAGSISFTVPGSGAVTDKQVTLAQLAALEPLLVAQATASHLTWTTKDDPATLADDPPLNVVTVLVTPHAAATDAQLLVTDLSIAGAVAVNLPAAAPIGHAVVVVDGKGDAGANNVTIAAVGGTINGGANVVINVNRGICFLYKTATNVWKAVLSSTVGAGAAGGALAGTYPNPTLANGAQVAGDITSSAAAESADHIDVTFQLKDLNNVNLAVAGVVEVWVSDTALAAPTGTAPDGGTVVQTGTLLKVDTTAVLLRAVTGGTGAIVIRVTESTAKTFFVNCSAGNIVQSQSITFA